MASRFLPVFVSNAVSENEEMLPAFVAGDVSLQEALRFCQRFRVAGIGSLLLSGTASQLHACLHRSARAFIYFLRRRPRAWPGSKAEPFFDAVACGDTEAALELARLAPKTADRRCEYEEDFLHARFWMEQGCLGAGEREGRELLLRYERVLEGSEDQRLAACRAFLDRDAQGFDHALAQMMEAREARYQVFADKEVLPEELLATEAYLSVEGLALVRFADSRGLVVAGEHLFVPSIARQPPTGGYRADDWMKLQP